MPVIRAKKEKQTIFYQMRDIDFPELWSYHCRYDVASIEGTTEDCPCRKVSSGSRKQSEHRGVEENESSLYSHRQMAGTFQSAVLCRHAQDGIRDQRRRSAAGSRREEGRLPAGFSASFFPEAAPAPCLAALHLRWQSLKVRGEGRLFFSDSQMNPAGSSALLMRSPCKRTTQKRRSICWRVSSTRCRCTLPWWSPLGASPWSPQVSAIEPSKRNRNPNFS